MRRATAAVVAIAMATATACVAGDAGTDADALTPTVEVFGPFRTEEADLLAASLADFEESSGISIRYTGTGSFVADLEAQIAADDPPDIALAPQPGLVAELVRNGDVVALSEETAAAVEEYYDEETRALGVVDGVAAAVPFQVSVKSLVWYRPDVFATHGYDIPATLDELDALVARIESDGLTPWCLGIEAQAATGWVATDWAEDLVLRLAGPEVYDDWVDGTVPFAAQQIAQAFRRFRELALTPGRVDGGISGVLRTPVRSSVSGLFTGAPDCVLHRQASFVYGLMPEGTEFGPDADVDLFVLPGVRADRPPPVLVGSTLAVAFTDDHAVDRVMTHLATPGSTRVWSEAGGFTTPRIASPLDGTPPAVDRAVRDVLLDAAIVRADASDAMPPAIGSSLYWQEITSWLADRTSYDDMAATLDDARAALDGPSG